MTSDKTRRNTRITKPVAPEGQDPQQREMESGNQETADFSVAKNPVLVPPIAEESLPKRLGRYELLKLLGLGGMGAVYLARDSQLHREVALKVPQWDGAAGPLAEKRFYREARAAANLSHPNLCPVYDVDQIDGVHCITMALIKGKPLADYIRPDKPLSARAAAKIVQKVALAMEDAHQAGIIHRDLKPSNIMIDHRNEPIVMDFGLAKASDSSEESRLTRDGTLIGSPAYMSPEQLRGREQEIGPASDQYALGTVLYELLSGRIPYDDSGSTITLLSQILTEPPQDLAALRPDLDATLVAIVDRAISKIPEDRFASMKDLAQALRDYLRGIEPQWKTPTSATPSGATPSGATSVAAGVEAGQSPPQSAAPPTRPLAAKGPATTRLNVVPPDDKTGSQGSSPSGSQTRAERTSRPTVALPSADRSVEQPVSSESRVGKSMLAMIILGGSLILLLGGLSLYLAFRGPGDPPPLPSEVSEASLADEDVSAEPERKSEPVDEQSRRAAQVRLDRMDANGDGELTENEIPQREVAPLMNWDTNQDGRLDRAELEAMPYQEPPPIDRHPRGDDLPPPGPGFDPGGRGPMGGPPPRGGPLGPGRPGAGPPGRRPGPGGNRPPF